MKGFDDHRGSQLGPFSQPWPGGPATSNGVLLPYALDAATMAAQCASNYDIPIHDWAPQHLSWNDGKMDRFVAVHSEQANDGAGEGPLVMAHQQQSDLPFYWSLAEQFTICDAYHCSVIAPTMPNRLYMWSGMIDPAGTGGGPIVSTPSFAESAGVIGTCDWKTVPEALTDASVSWKVYQPPNTSVGPTMSENLAIGFNALLYFKQYVEYPKSELYKNAFLPSWPDDFAADVHTGKLPQVSWLVPSLIDSEHPSTPPLNGQYYVSQVIKTLASNEELWAKTVVFIMYDENGGFFDHVPPPTAPTGTPGEALTVNPLPAHAAGIAGPIGLGFRVPMIVVSPFSKGGDVNSQLFDHTSMSRFLETRFGMKAPNITDWRRKTVGDLVTTLNVAEADTSFPSLPAVTNDPSSLQAACPDNQSDAGLLQPAPTLTIPLPQSMPKQQAGKARRGR